MPTAYDFSFETVSGAPYHLNQLAGSPLVVVNTASKCGFTPQYKALQAAWRQFQGAGLTIIGVPSNDFANQEPGSNAEISSFCEINYGVDFPIMGKVHVKGPDAHPFFKWAAEEGGFLARPRWNFFKYLINKKGQLEEWFSPLTKPDSAKFNSEVQKLFYQ